MNIEAVLFGGVIFRPLAPKLVAHLAEYLAGNLGIGLLAAGKEALAGILRGLLQLGPFLAGRAGLGRLAPAGRLPVGVLTGLLLRLVLAFR